MKIKIGICVIMMLLLVASSFTVVTNIKANTNFSETMPIEVVKKVWDGNDWVDEITANYGDTVRYNITVTYHNNTEEGLLAEDIVIVDTLPELFDYAGNVSGYQPSWIENNIIIWNLSEDYDVILAINESVSVEFDAVALNYGINENFAEGTAFELCCNWTLYGNDTANVIVGEPIVILKEVFDPESNEWVEDLTSYVKKSEPLKFRLTITYNGYFDVDLMKCMYVEDFLPDCCLEYLGNEEYTYPDPDLFDDPSITVSPDKKYVKYDWTNKKFNLYAGESIIIEFETSVVYYCYDWVINCAYVQIYNCLQCPNPVILNDTDCSNIYCYPPSSMLEKKVFDSDTSEWVEEITVFINEIVTFKIDLTYYGNYNLTNISISDELHPSMEFVDSPEYTPEIEGNTLWWNFTGPLNDSETISIEFTAKAIAGTGAGPGIDIAYVSALENGHLYQDSDTAGVKVLTNVPPCPPDIKGNESGITGEVLKYYAVTGDYDNNTIWYMFDWGDGSSSNWLGPYNPKQEVSSTHIFASPGTYYVKAKAKDDPIGDESGWSFYPVEVKISRPPILSLNVTIKRGLGLSVSASIENDGEATLNNIQWTLTVQRRGLFQKVLFEDTNTISLNVGDIEKLTGTPRGFGLMKVTVEVNAPGVDPIEVTANGFIFFRLVYIS